LSTSQSTTSPSASPTTEPSVSAADDPIQLLGATDPAPTETSDATPPAPAPNSLAAPPPGSSELAITNYDDGFSDSVPFQALVLRINRSKGVYLLEGDADERDEVFLVPRGSAPAKSYYGLPYDPKTPHEASCSSPDGKLGYGWIDASAQDDSRVRSCVSCPRRGYGAGTCDDLQTLLAYDVGKHTPVLITFKNAEINPRRGVFTLAVNRMRTLGLKPTDSVFRLTFGKADGPYFNVRIDVLPIADANLPDGKADEITTLLDNCWHPYRESIAADAASLQAQVMIA